MRHAQYAHAIEKKKPHRGEKGGKPRRGEQKEVRMEVLLPMKSTIQTTLLDFYDFYRNLTRIIIHLNSFSKRNTVFYLKIFFASGLGSLQPAASARALKLTLSGP